MLEWKVAVGDTVEHDQVVVEVKTAKSVVTLPIPYAGTVTARHSRAGEVVQVGAPLLSVGEAAEASGSGAVLIGYGTSARPVRRLSPRTATASDPDASDTPDTPDAPVDVERFTIRNPVGPRV